MDKVTIVTPSYNQGRFIKQCIDSVRNQTYRPIEHIIVDNCSTDETSAILSEYKNNTDGIEVILIVEPDGGQSEAINKGFKLASGDIICWLNTDEYYVPEALSKVGSYLYEHTLADVVFGDCNFVDTCGNIIKHKREFFFLKSMLLYYGCFIPSCATFVRTKIIESGIFLNQEFRVTMDFDWYVRIAKAGFHFEHMRETIASFTWHESNLSTTQSERRKFERRLVQDRYSGVKGSVFYRTWFYQIMQYFWMGVRTLRRAIG